MPGDIWGFVQVTAPNGKRMLLNLDMTLALVETDKGTDAVSMAGVRAEMATAFENFIQDLMTPLALSLRRKNSRPALLR